MLNVCFSVAYGCSTVYIYVWKPEKHKHDRMNKGRFPLAMMDGQNYYGLLSYIIKMLPMATTNYFNLALSVFATAESIWRKIVYELDFASE